MTVHMCAAPLQRAALWAPWQRQVRIHPAIVPAWPTRRKQKPAVAATAMPVAKLWSRHSGQLHRLCRWKRGSASVHADAAINGERLSRDVGGARVAEERNRRCHLFRRAKASDRGDAEHVVAQLL